MCKPVELGRSTNRYSLIASKFELSLPHICIYCKQCFTLINTGDLFIQNCAYCSTNRTENYIFQVIPLIVHLKINIKKLKLITVHDSYVKYCFTTATATLSYCLQHFSNLTSKLFDKKQSYAKVENSCFDSETTDLYMFVLCMCIVVFKT